MRTRRAVLQSCPSGVLMSRRRPSPRHSPAPGMNLIDVRTDLRPEHDHLSIDEAWNTLRSQRPMSEDLVVCHGDYCFPNVLVSGGTAVAYVDPDYERTAYYQLLYDLVS